MESKVKTKNIGKAVGTIGWLEEYLTGSELILGQTDLGWPCIYLERVDKIKTILAFIEPNDIDSRVCYKYHDDNIASIHPETNEIEEGFAGYLTPAAYKVVDSLINESVEILRNYLGSEKQTFELIIKKS